MPGATLLELTVPRDRVETRSTFLPAGPGGLDVVSAEEITPLQPRVWKVCRATPTGWQVGVTVAPGANAGQLHLRCRFGSERVRFSVTLTEASPDLWPTREALDRAEADTFVRSGRSASAARWYLAHLEEDDGATMRAWVVATRTAIPVPDFAEVAAVASQWLDAHPESPYHPLVAAEVAAWDWGPAFERAGAWCPDVERLLLGAPESGPAGVESLEARIKVERVCTGRSTEALHEQWHDAAMALGGIDALRAAVSDRGWGEDELAQAQTLLQSDPEGAWQVALLLGGTTGSQKSAARALLAETGRALSQSDRPTLVEVGARLLHSAGERVLEREALERLVRLDPTYPRASGTPEHGP